MEISMCFFSGSRWHAVTLVFIRATCCSYEFWQLNSHGASGNLLEIWQSCRLAAQIYFFFFWCVITSSGGAVSKRAVPAVAVILAGISVCSALGWMEQVALHPITTRYQFVSAAYVTLRKWEPLFFSWNVQGTGANWSIISLCWSKVTEIKKNNLHANTWCCLILTKNLYFFFLLFSLFSPS